MNYLSSMQKLADALSGRLPGTTAHTRLSPAMRVPPNFPLPDTRQARRSAVLLLLYPINEQLHLALMERSLSNFVHSGQISFPGGGVELGDADWVHTALRETEEEFGCNTDNFAILGLISPLYIPVSNSWVQPVVAFSDTRPDFVPNPDEVAQILELKLNDFLQADAVQQTTVKSGIGYTMQVPAYLIQGHTIWGATAMMLSEFLEIYSQIE